MIRRPQISVRVVPSEELDRCTARVRTCQPTLGLVYRDGHLSDGASSASRALPFQDIHGSITMTVFR